MNMNILNTTRTVDQIRLSLAKNYLNEKFYNGTVEILNATFIADKDTIFGTLNEDYAEREIQWYRSMSLNINDIPGEPPKIWKDISDKDGFVNSNYGWCIFSGDNGYQLDNCIRELVLNKDSRRATMIYNRPSMHSDYNQNGMNDFMCTFSVQLFIRDDTLYYMVYMRSNDAVFGYKNDRYWHNWVRHLVFNGLKQRYPKLSMAPILWNAATLHVYERHYNLIDKWIEEFGAAGPSIIKDI